MTSVDWVLLVFCVLLIVLAMSLAWCLDRLRGQGAGARMIADERERQIEDEAWSPNRDMAYLHDELALAATCYAMPPERRDWFLGDGQPIPVLWPWAASWWKPGDRKRELVKAGALIAAELDRILLAEARARQRAQTFNADPHATA